MKQKMKQFATHIFAICCLLGLAACSKEHIDTPVTDKNTVNTTVGNLQFSFTEHDFGAEQSLNTRTAPAAKPQKMDLGDDLEADVTVEEEAPAASTRASKPMSDGTYTIVAYKTDGTRYGSTLLKGTVASGVFTVDPAFDEKMYLPDGETLTFVCFNDKVTDDGTNLTVSAANVEKALVGITTVTMAINQRQTISFEMKHPGARIRTKIIAMVQTKDDIKTLLETKTPATSIPTDARYNSSNQDYVATATANYQKALSYPIGEWLWGQYFNNPDYTGNAACDYQYFLPHTPISAFKLTFTAGKVYLKELNGQTLSFANSVQTEANKSYCINITLKFKGLKFLFHDGAVGRLNDPAVAGKTPIAVVVKENDGAANSGLAMALQELNGYTWTRNYGGYYEHTKQAFTKEEMIQDLDGYNYTYTASFSRYGVAHSADVNFPAFQAVANYEPAVASLNARFKKGHWFMPSSGEWYQMANNLGFFEDLYPSVIYGNRYYVFLKKAMEQTGGADIESTDVYKFYWSSTEKNQWEMGSVSVTRMSMSISTSYGAKGGSSSLYTRPFIHF